MNAIFADTGYWIALFNPRDDLHAKALTVRIPEARLRKLMRARKAKTQSDLINTLLTEEEEQLHAHQVLRNTAGALKPAEINDRLL